MVMAVVIVRSAPLESTAEMPYLPPVESPVEVTSYEYTPTDSGYNYRWDNEIGSIALLLSISLCIPFKMPEMFINLALCWATPSTVKKRWKLKIKAHHKKKPLLLDITCSKATTDTNIISIIPLTKKELTLQSIEHLFIEFRRAHWNHWLAKFILKCLSHALKYIAIRVMAPKISPDNFVVLCRNIVLRIINKDSTELQTEFVWIEKRKRNAAKLVLLSVRVKLRRVFFMLRVQYTVKVIVSLNKVNNRTVRPK